MRPVQRPIVAASLSATACSPASGGVITDDFESYPVATVPGGPWHDIADRGVVNPSTNPSMFGTAHTPMRNHSDC